MSNPSMKIILKYFSLFLSFVMLISVSPSYAAQLKHEFKITCDYDLTLDFCKQASFEIPPFDAKLGNLTALGVTVRNRSTVHFFGQNSTDEVNFLYLNDISWVTIMTQTSSYYTQYNGWGEKQPVAGLIPPYYKITFYYDELFVNILSLKNYVFDYDGQIVSEKILISGMGGVWPTLGGVNSHPLVQISQVLDIGVNFTYEIASVPEPGVWSLMIAGFGFVGGALRRSSRKNYVVG